MQKTRIHIKTDCYNLSIEDIEQMVREKYGVGSSWSMIDVNLTSHDCKYKGLPWNLEVAFDKQREEDIS